MITLKPLGDRILIKLCREEERKIGETVLTLARSNKQRVQPETAKYLVVALGDDVGESIRAGDFVVCRSDAGAVLSRDVLGSDDHRLYRLVEFPEVLSVLHESSEISSASDVIKEKVVI